MVEDDLGSGLRVQGLGFSVVWVQGLWLRMIWVQGLAWFGFRVYG